MGNINECWLPVIGFEGRYEVSSLGRVRKIDLGIKNSKLNSLLLRPFFSPSLYLLVGLYCGGERVHRLVAQAFIPNPENKPEVNHINGIKWDNRVENLEWTTRKENSDHAQENMLFMRQGTYNAASKFSEEQVKDIYYSEDRAIDLAKRYNVYVSTINKIRCRDTYKCLGFEKINRRNKK